MIYPCARFIYNMEVQNSFEIWKKLLEKIRRATRGESRTKKERTKKRHGGGGNGTRTEHKKDEKERRKEK